MLTEGSWIQEGELLGHRYQVRDKLGSGGMGAVYRAVDYLTGEEVALKRVETKGVVSPNSAFKLALAQEFQSLAALHHPNIIAVRDYGFAAEGQPFFTMELLSHSIPFTKAGQFADIPKKIDLLVQLLQTLVYLHRHKIIHRDLKPSNVLLADNSVKVLDFGLATIVGQKSEPSGTLKYMAPEVLQGQPSSIASDLYSVGVMGYELFSGWHPFAETRVGLVNAILHETPDFTFVEAPPSIAAVLQRLLDKNPANRFATAADTVTALCQAAGQDIPAETTATRESFLQAAPFIGRDQELRKLLEQLADAKQSHGSGWLIGGESGVGKSRLLHEVRTRALVKGVFVLRGQGQVGGGAFHLWRELLPPLILLTQPDERETAVLESLVPNIETLLGRSVSPAPALPPEASRQRLLLTIINLLHRATVTQPLLVLLEDCHWADENSLELLQWSLRDVAQYPLLILASYRLGELPSLSEALSAMHMLPLRRLSDIHIAQLSEAMLGPSGRKSQLINFLQQESEGNTFFIVEVVRILAEETGRLEDISTLELPLHIFSGGMREVIQRRLARVPDTFKPVLQFMAVVGRQIDLNLCRYLFPDLAVDDWLTLCANAAVLTRPDGALHWQFSHDKLREGLLNNLSIEQKNVMHQKIGEGIEAVYADNLAEYYGQLAHHFGKAHDLERERKYAGLAGVQAAAQFANEDALKFFERALSLTPSDKVAEQFEKLLEREKVYNVLGKREEQQQDLESAAALIPLLSGHTLIQQTKIALHQANYAEVLGDHETSVELAQRAVRLAQTAGSTELEAEARLNWGIGLWRLSHYEAAQNQLKRSLALARSAGLANIEGIVMENLGTVALHQAEYTEATEILNQALQLFQQIGNRQGESHILNNLGGLHGFMGQYEKGRAYFEQALQIYHEIGDRRHESNALNNLGSIACYLGDYENGKAYYAQANQLFRAVDDQHGEAMTLNNLGFATRCLGKYEESESYFLDSLRMRRVVGDRHGQGLSLLNLGALYHRLGAYDEARSHWQEALQLFQEIGDGRGHSWGLAHLSLLAHHQRQNELALSLSNEAFEMAQKIGARSQIGYALSVRGHALRALRQTVEARTAYEAAIAIRQELGEHQFATETAAGLAQLFMMENKLEMSLHHINSILEYMETHSLEGTNEPFHIYLACVQILRAAQDSRAASILDTALALLKKRADELSKLSWQHRFINGIEAHQTLFSLK